MVRYRQYCPIARASEILAERWTPIILRNLLSGATTFTELAGGAPGLSRTLLTTRLRQLEHEGVVVITAHPTGRGHHYGLTEAGRALGPVLTSMGEWAQQWLGLDPANSDPGFLLHNWCTHYLVRERLPRRRVVVRFDLTDQPSAERRIWVIFDAAHPEVCLHQPGYPDDLVVTTQSTTLARWHLGQVEWAQALRSGQIQVDGPRSLARALPTWSSRSAWAQHG